MRLLVANPNTTEAVTALVVARARAVAGPGTEIVGATAAFGAGIIGTRREMAVAEHASVAMLEEHAGGCDGVIVGASLDSGVRAARAMLACPVVGITEAALHAACLLGSRFGVVTLSARSAAITREMVEGYGLAGRMAGVRFVTAAPHDVLADAGAFVPGLVEAAERLVDDGADAVVLVGAVMAEMVGRVQPSVTVPVVEGVSCAVGLVSGLVRLRTPKATAGSYA